MPTEPPPGVIAVPLTKECLVLLTEREYVAGIRRGKWWRRRAAMERRGQAAPTAHRTRLPRRVDRERTLCRVPVCQIKAHVRR